MSKWLRVAMLSASLMLGVNLFIGEQDAVHSWAFNQDSAEAESQSAKAIPSRLAEVSSPGVGKALAPLSPAQRSASLSAKAGFAQSASGGDAPKRLRHTTATLWQTWKKYLKIENWQQLPVLGARLAKRLQHQSNPWVYQQIDSLLSSPGVSIENKAILIDLLSDTATPQALALLLKMIEQGQSSTGYFLALSAIIRVGDNRWGGRFHEELSPLLETAWANPAISDPALLTTLASAIAKLGAPQGVDLLLQTVSSADLSPDGEAETRRARQEAAFLAIPQTRNPEAVPVLNDWFMQTDLGSPIFEASGDALAAIGTPESTEKIVAWAKDAPDQGARNLEAWLAQVEDDRTMQAIAAVPTESFRSSEVATVLRKFLYNPGF